MLDYFGQSPIIVRSSSLLEDNFGHSFAGKYESVFLASQGSREQRFQDFVSAVRTIYASTMSEDALNYRARRGMLKQDEQMALLVQRVSGALHGNLFFPHVAGVGFSHNPYVWSGEIDPKAGVLRLVFGLGTRAVDRIDDDYTRLVALNAPERCPIADPDEAKKYTQRRADVLDLQANQLVAENVEDVVKKSHDIPMDIFASPNTTPPLLTFEKLLKETDYVDSMSQILKQLQKSYGVPVDMEFTTNFNEENAYKINLVQCRPLQIKGDTDIIEPPAAIKINDLVFRAFGAIIGHSRVCNIDRVIYIVPSVYGHLSISERYTVARLLGKLIHLRESKKPENIMLMGPGRWGTSTPSLGVPVAFSEICKVSVIGEIVAMREDFVPEVSLGTHFFSEMVEADTLYFALFPGKKNNQLNSSLIESMPNRFSDLMPEEAKWANVIHVIDKSGFGDRRSMVINANTLNQSVIYYLEKMI